MLFTEGPSAARRCPTAVGNKGGKGKERKKKRRRGRRSSWRVQCSTILSTSEVCSPCMVRACAKKERGRGEGRKNELRKGSSHLCVMTNDLNFRRSGERGRGRKPGERVVE